ncbi:MAG: hypothetical protein IJG19_06890 [Methanobrevibacter sp.]|nr:hypothetical protein [Methanobrevibacter sp.]
MPFTPPDLSEILTNEQELNTKLNSCKSELQSILTKEGIDYTSSEGIIPLIRKLPYPTPTTIELFGTKEFLTKDGSQTYNRSMDLRPIVRDQNGKSMMNLSVTIRRRSGTTSGAWTTLGTITTGQSLNVTPQSNNGNYRYEAYVTNNSNVSIHYDVPNYYMYYPAKYGQILASVVDYANPMEYSNCRINTEDFSMGGNFIDLYAQSAGQMYAIFPLKYYPPLTHVDTNTNIQIGFDITRGNVPVSTKAIGIGGGMYNPEDSYGGSLGLFLDASDGDTLTSRDTFFIPQWSTDNGFTESGVSKECYIQINGTYNGGYAYMYGEGGDPSDYMPYWYGESIGTPVVMAYANNVSANEKVRLKIKYIRAVTP